MSDHKVMTVERPQAFGPGYEKGDLRIVELGGALRIPRAYHAALIRALIAQAGGVEAEIVGWHKQQEEYFLRIIDPTVDATTGRYLLLPMEGSE